MRQGWECPVCHVGLNPDQPKCHHDVPQKPLSVVWENMSVTGYCCICLPDFPNDNCPFHGTSPIAKAFAAANKLKVGGR